MTHELAVWLFADCVGTLSRVAGRMRFCYNPAWLTHPQAVALSASLPLQAEPFDEKPTRAFFAGLLPEGHMRRVIAQRLQVSNLNDFALLDHIGGECAGAVTILPLGQALLQPRDDAHVQWLRDEDIVQLLDELRRRPMLAGENGLRLSLAGAQDKLPVVFDGERIGLPRDGTPSSHILKPTIQGLEDTVINEGYCLALAETLQLNQAKTQIRRVRDREFLLVKRYDRHIDANMVRRRRHQEDFCQALGVTPELKYQNEGGSGLTQCFELVRRVTRPSAPQVLRLFDAVLFNVLIGNHDAPAKNFSLLQADSTPILAPLYDLLSTAVYPDLSSKMAMKIGSEYTFSDIHARHWDQFAESTGLAKAAAKKRVLAVANLLPSAARKLQSDPAHRFATSPLVERINGLIEQRCATTIRRLGEVQT